MNDSIPQSRAPAVRQSQDPIQRLSGLVQRMLPEIARALPKHIHADRIARIVTTAIRITPKLAQTSEASFLGAVLTASQLGLEVNTPAGHAYLIPYGSTCQLIIGYRGMLDLARRSGSITKIVARAVHDGDEFSYTMGLDETIVHKPSSAPDRDRKPVTHVYAVAHQIAGPPIFEVLTRSQVMARKARSRSAGSGPWVTDEAAMMLKTAIRQIWKWLPMSAEMKRADAMESTDDTNVRVTQAAAYDPEITAALEGAGLAIEAEAEHVALPAAASPAAAFNREAPVRSVTRGREPGEDPIESFLEREDERGGR